MYYASCNNYFGIYLLDNNEYHIQTSILVSSWKSSKWNYLGWEVCLSSDVIRSSRLYLLTYYGGYLFELIKVVCLKLWIMFIIFLVRSLEFYWSWLLVKTRLILLNFSERWKSYMIDVCRPNVADTIWEQFRSVFCDFILFLAWDEV